MEFGNNYKGNSDKMIHDDMLWQDPMSYPAYDSRALLERAATGRREATDKSLDIEAGKVAA